MKSYPGSGGITPAFLTSILLRVEWSASRPGRFTSGERTPLPYTLNARLGGPQKQSGRGSEEKNIPASAENRTPVVQPVAWSLNYLS
jgi:hypothetical protein